jgi:hypothetical protein
MNQPFEDPREQIGRIRGQRFSEIRLLVIEEAELFNKPLIQDIFKEEICRFNTNPTLPLYNRFSGIKPTNP